MNSDCNSPPISRPPRVWLEFERRVAADWPPQRWRDLTVVVAVSGGADSTALLCALHRLRDDSDSPCRGRLIVAHLHHGLRGAEADADLAAVESLAERLNLPCETSRVAVDPAMDASEADLRNLRYQFLREVAHRHGARYLAVAHTADDQVETVLHRIARGAGIAGLAGMPRIRRLSPALTLVRPLLQRRRQEVVDYLRELGQSWREDASNAEATYTRNRIRHQLLPWLRSQINPSTDDAVLRLARLAAETQEIVDSAVAELSQAAVRIVAPDRAVIATSLLRDRPPALVRALLHELWRQQNWPAQAMTFDHWQQLAAWTLAAVDPVNPATAVAGGEFGEPAAGANNAPPIEAATSADRRRRIPDRLELPGFVVAQRKPGDQIELAVALR